PSDPAARGAPTTPAGRETAAGSGVVGEVLHRHGLDRGSLLWSMAGAFAAVGRAGGTCASSRPRQSFYRSIPRFAWPERRAVEARWNMARPNSASGNASHHHARSHQSLAKSDPA